VYLSSLVFSPLYRVDRECDNNDQAEDLGFKHN
jgi:hypothetical protein